MYPISYFTNDKFKFIRPEITKCVYNRYNQNRYDSFYDPRGYRNNRHDIGTDT